MKNIVSLDTPTPPKDNMYVSGSDQKLCLSSNTTENHKKSCLLSEPRKDNKPNCSSMKYDETPQVQDEEKQKEEPDFFNFYNQELEPEQVEPNKEFIFNNCTFHFHGN